MVGSHQQDQEDHDAEVPIVRINNVGNCKDHETAGNPVCSATQESVHDVAAIKLTDRHHVEAGN
jgi:hypothetical protein